MKKTKIVIIGAGHVGSHCAAALIARSVCSEIVLIDIDTDKARSQGLDLGDSVIYSPQYVRVNSGDYQDCQDADIVVMCVGTPPDFNRSRMEYLQETVGMMKTIIGPLKASGFSGILINISNPADVITQYLQSGTGFAPQRVISTSTMLDSARLKRILASQFRVEPQQIQAYALGEHGASLMVPWSNVFISGKPLFRLMAEKTAALEKISLEDIAEKTKRAAYEVIFGKGSTEFGIGAALAELANAIINDEHKVLPVSVLLEGQYGQNGVYASVPARIGKKGVEEIKEVPLTDSEFQEFAASCAEIRKNYQLAKSL